MLGGLVMCVAKVPGHPTLANISLTMYFDIYLSEVDPRQSRPRLPFRYRVGANPSGLICVVVELAERSHGEG